MERNSVRAWLTRSVRYRIVKLIAPSVFNLAFERPRPMVERVAKHFCRPLTGVEIGVEYGKNAKSMLESLPIEKLYLVDPWVEALTIAKENLSEHREKTVFLFMKSEDAVDKIPNDLDFVYIDGNHSYKVVKKDLNDYYPKVRFGGILGGHDFQFEEVRKAVTEFAWSKKLDLNIASPDWFFVRGEHLDNDSSFEARAQRVILTN